MTKDEFFQFIGDIMTVARVKETKSIDIKK